MKLTIYSWKQVLSLVIFLLANQLAAQRTITGLVTEAETGDPLIGVVYVPDLEKCYTSIKGNGVRLNDRPFVRELTETNNNMHLYMDSSCLLYTSDAADEYQRV